MKTQFWIIGLFFFSASASYGLPTLTTSNIQIDVQQPSGYGNLSATASIFKNRLVIGGDMNRPPAAAISGRVHIVVYHVDGETIAEKFITPSSAGRRGENRRQFSSDFDFPEPPANLRIMVRYEEPR